jgi:hypothetical protein
VSNSILEILFLLADVFYDFGADGVRAGGHQARARGNQAGCLLGESERHGCRRQTARRYFIRRQADDGEFIERDRRADDCQRGCEAKREVQPAANG